mgnify:CR=1 FL=1
MVFKIVRQGQYIQFIQSYQLIQQEQVQRATFKSGGLMQLTVCNTIGVRFFNPSDLFIDKPDQCLFDLKAGSIFR